MDYIPSLPHRARFTADKADAIGMSVIFVTSCLSYSTHATGKTDTTGTIRAANASAARVSAQNPQPLDKVEINDGDEPHESTAACLGTAAFLGLHGICRPAGHPTARRYRGSTLCR